MSLRQSLLQAISHMIEIDCLKVIAVISPQVRDIHGCNVMWSISALANQEAVEVSQKAVSLVIRKRGNEMVSMYYNSMNDYVSVGM